MNPMTMTEKILAAHSGQASVRPGQLVNARIDVVMCHDVTTPPAITMPTHIIREAFIRPIRRPGE